MLVSVDNEVSSSVSLIDPSELNSSGVSSSKSKFSNPFDGEELLSSVLKDCSEVVDDTFSVVLVSSSTFVELTNSSELSVSDVALLSVSALISSSILRAFAPLVMIELFWLENVNA